MKLVLAVLGLVLPLAALAGDIGYAAKDLEIRSEPSFASTVIGRLPRNGRIELLQRQMGWARISTANQQGCSHELLARLRKYHGKLPADFKFDRIEANARS